jgi:tRNA A37 threonylcarbamoyladenosine dehydratase
MEGEPPEAVSDGTFFDRLGLLMGAEAVDAFKGLRVAVFGVGGVGGWCAESLVRSGVGHLMIVDSDRVCASNVNRQVMATSRTVGQMKVEALRERLQEINPAAEVIAEARVYSAETADTFDLGSFDYVVDAIDSMRAKAHLINAVTRLERPTLVSSMGAARKTDPFRIRQSEFWKVQGDGLARALRRRFRQLGEFPAKKFTCVWSDELPAPLGEGGALGSAVHVTAMFGFALAGLVLRAAAATFPPCAERGNVQ